MSIIYIVNSSLFGPNQEHLVVDVEGNVAVELE